MLDHNQSIYEQNSRPDHAALPLSVAAVTALGLALTDALEKLLAAVPSTERGPVALARALTLDKVLLSRVLKAIRMRDGAGSLRAMPGPEPLRRLIARAGERGAAPGAVANAVRAVDEYDRFLRQTVRGRGMLDTILSAWDPDSRRQFEQRRKQAAFTAISQIRGAQARVNHATVIVSPAGEPDMLDVVWASGYLGLYRSRPGARVKCASRRLAPPMQARRPASIDGRPLDAPDAMLLRDFCSNPPPRLDATTIGESIFYTLAGEDFGVASAVDLVYAEINRAELPAFVPAGSGRRKFFFAETAVPSEVLFFDILVHASLRWSDPELIIYDTAYEGAASPNDPARDLDRLDMLESVQRLAELPPQAGGGPNLRSPDAPRYADLIRAIAATLSLNPREFVAHRVRIEYPLYGSQITLAFPGIDQPA